MHQNTGIRFPPTACAKYGRSLVPAYLQMGVGGVLVSPHLRCDSAQQHEAEMGDCANASPGHQDHPKHHGLGWLNDEDGLAPGTVYRKKKPFGGRNGEAVRAAYKERW